MIWTADLNTSSPTAYIVLIALAILVVGYYMYNRPADGATFNPPSVDPVYGCTDITATNYDPNANQEDGSCNYEKKAIKTIQFKTSNMSLPGIEIIIKDDTDKTLDVLTTNSNGEATFTLTDRNSLKIKYLHEKFTI